MVRGVLLKRKANGFVRAALLVAALAGLPAKITGAVEAERVDTIPGTAGLFFCADGRGPDGQKSHTPARTSRPGKIQYVERERIRLTTRTRSTPGSGIIVGIDYPLNSVFQNWNIKIDQKPKLAMHFDRRANHGVSQPVSVFVRFNECLHLGGLGVLAVNN
jgi:hypothetical protein